MAFAPGGDGFIPGGNHANLCLEWNKSVSAWRNSSCLDAALVLKAEKVKTMAFLSIHNNAVNSFI